MALCERCEFYNKELDEMRQEYDDVIKKDDTTINHYCPMYDGNIPHDIFNGGGNCLYFSERGQKGNGLQA